MRNTICVVQPERLEEPQTTWPLENAIIQVPVHTIDPVHVTWVVHFGVFSAMVRLSGLLGPHLMLVDDDFFRGYSASFDRGIFLGKRHPDAFLLERLLMRSTSSRGVAQ